jgi:hypothetical protein
MSRKQLRSEIKKTRIYQEKCNARVEYEAAKEKKKLKRNEKIITS